MGGIMKWRAFILSALSTLLILALAILIHLSWK